MSSRQRHTHAIYPGSFDPITYGHEDIVRRTLGFCDGVIVAIGRRATQPKAALFSIDERVELIEEVFRDEDRVRVTAFGGLLVDFAREQDVHLVVRGLRAVSDFEYEFQMALMNRQLNEKIETLFLAPDSRYSYLSASLVREIAALDGDVTPFVSPHVRDRLIEKLRGG